MKRKYLIVGLCVLMGTGMAPAAAASGATAAQAADDAGAIGHGFHATITAKPGKGEELIALLYDAPAFQNPDCLIFLIGRSKANPDVIYLTEGWRSEAAHRRFTDTETAKAYTARFAPLVAEESTYLDEVPIGGKAIID